MKTMWVMCVPEEEAQAAHESALAMASLGVALVVFASEKSLQAWVDAVAHIPELSVKRLQASSALPLHRPQVSAQQERQ